jgi:hypothetical protein
MILGAMPHASLHDFVTTHRAALILSCRDKAAQRRGVIPAETDNRGVSLLLEQLIGELHDGVSRTDAIKAGAGEHGRNLLRQGYTVAQVVYDYGDVCQAVTEFAVERAVQIGPQEFRTLNRCLDDAIAGALTEYARGRSVTRGSGPQVSLRVLLDTASTAFDAIETGRVGARGSTGALLTRSLEAMRSHVDQN